MPEQRRRDWLKFWIHFFCGALLGAIAGFTAWGRSSYGESTSFLPAVVFVGGGAILVGLIAGAAADTGDHFWHDVSGWFRWW